MATHPQIPDLADAPAPDVLVSILGEGPGREASLESLKRQIYRATQWSSPRRSRPI